MTNNPKMPDRRIEASATANATRSSLLKAKSKSSTNIDDQVNVMMTPNRRHLTTGPVPFTATARSRLRKFLMFGREHSKSNTSCDDLAIAGSSATFYLEREFESTFSSNSTERRFGGSSSSLLMVAGLPTSSPPVLVANGRRLTKSYCSSPVCTSPKLMVSNCLDDGTNGRKYQRKKHQNSIKSVRVIKPTAIHPSINYDPPRPSTSVGVLRMQSESSFGTSSNRHSSAFHQVRSNSLSEPLVAASHFRPQHAPPPPNPYSNPISMESIETKDDWNSEEEPIHMTLEEVRRIAFGSPERLVRRPAEKSICSPMETCSNRQQQQQQQQNPGAKSAKSKIKTLFDNLLNKTTMPSCMGGGGCAGDYSVSPSATANTNLDNIDDEREAAEPESNRTKSPVLMTMHHIRDLLWNHHHDGHWAFHHHRRRVQSPETSADGNNQSLSSPFIRRALPPVPPSASDDENDTTDHNNNSHCSHYQSSQRVSRHQFKSMSEYERKKYLDYVSSIEKVKNCGWYWGPISGEIAEKLLDSEACGSFLVRDSSDEHYIFSLSFKLDGMVRHVRIEQEQGNFSFGSLKKFRSSTIVDFIESAMEHSRSGQFLFFLRLGPELGPIRVQLLHPVSRFKRVQSLQHICRFVILQYVRRDQIQELALPEYLRQYLDTPYYYSEELAQMQHNGGNNHQNQQERILDMKRNFFLQTNYQTLLEKMLIDRDNIERQLSIRLPRDFPENDPTSSH